MGRIIDGGDGQSYEEVISPSGDITYNPVAAPTRRPTPEVSDFDKLQNELRAADSHKEFFKNKLQDEKAVKQQLNRQKRLEKLTEAMVRDMVTPPSNPSVLRIKDERYLELHREYQSAESRGEGKRCDFQPLSTYLHKLTKKDGTMLRPLYQGEVGMLGEQTVVLEAGYGTGNFAQVPHQVTGGLVDEFGRRLGDSGQHGGSASGPSGGAEPSVRALSGAEGGVDAGTSGSEQSQGMRDDGSSGSWLNDLQRLMSGG